MKLLKSFFLALTLSILSYSAFVAQAQDLPTGETGTYCCAYQVDCPDSEQLCFASDKDCSTEKPGVCGYEEEVE